MRVLLIVMLLNGFYFDKRSPPSVAGFYIEPLFIKHISYIKLIKHTLKNRMTSRTEKKIFQPNSRDGYR